MKLLAITSLLTLASGVAIPDPSIVDYDGWKVLRVKTGHAIDEVYNKLSHLNYDEWANEGRRHIDIALSPDQLEVFETLDLDYHCMHENLGRSIAAETANMPSIWKRQADDLAWWDTYHPYADHKQCFEDIQAEYPDNSEIFSSGTSFENRDLYGLHFWGADGPGKPAILWHATVHAREWITAMVVEYLTYQLLGTYATDNVTQYFVDNYDFYIIPFANPDGFVHSQEVERLWRKNRMPPPPPPANQSCFGRDINRNWPFMWDANDEGASTNPCSAVYRGEEPGDTPENLGLRNFVNKLRDEQGIKLYIDWHSYGQYILGPWGYNCTIVPDEVGEHIQLARITSETIRDYEGGYDTTFTFGPSCSTLYATTGSSVDYIYGPGESDWSYTIELRDTGDFGFVLPPEQIRPSAEEQWAGMQAMLSLLDEVFFDGEGPAVEVRA